MSTFAEAIGIVIYAGALTAAVAILVRHARTAGVLAPVLVALALRLGCMIATQAVSVSHGHGGFFFLDDRGYDAIGRRLAEQWRHGHVVDVTSYQYAGSLQFGFKALVGFVYTLVGAHVLAVKLMNVVVGSISVLLAAMLARNVVSSAACRRTAWLVALCPTLVWWSSTMLKEAICVCLLLIALLGVTHLPRARGVLAFALGLVALAITRPNAAVGAGTALVLGIGVAAALRRREVSWRAVCGLTGGAVALVLIALLVTTRGNPRVLVSDYLEQYRSATNLYGTGNPLHVPVDVARTLIAPYPWAFDAATANWYRALYPGMWVWYILLPTAAVGIWRLRREVDVLLLVLPVLVLLVLNAISIGFAFRQRSTIEPLLLILVAAGFSSWRRLALCGAVGLSLVDVFAVAQSGSFVVGASIGLGAAALAAAALALPAADRSGRLAEGSCLERTAVALQLPGLSGVATVVPQPQPLLLPNVPSGSLRPATRVLPATARAVAAIRTATAPRPLQLPRRAEVPASFNAARSGLRAAWQRFRGIRR